jgi:hypothetical protein
VKHEVPEALRMEHEELGDQLRKALDAGGKTGEAAKKVMQVLRPHILLEEEYAMPPLTILARLARGEVTPEMRRYLAPAEMLKAELPRMLDEHKLIVEALRDLLRAATEEHQYGYAGLAQKMILHAQLEEEVLYPASILVGEYLRSKLGST